MKKLILLIFLGFVSLHSSTDVSGSISSDTTWSSAGDGIFRIIGDITIDPGATLTIEPGVTINFTGIDTFRVLINGSLNAIGTINDSIIFKHEISGQKHFSLDFINASDTSTLEYCRIQDGIAPSDGSYGGAPDHSHGGGILISNSPVIINHCSIIKNSARFGGGIFVLSSSSVQIENNIIGYNTGNLYGGGIGTGSSDLSIVRNNIIVHNTMTGGGGAGLSIANNVDIELVNNLIYQNSARGSGGGGLLILGSGNSIIARNCIFWNNSATALSNEIETGPYTDSLTVEYSDVEGSYPGIGNINTDPAFNDAANMNFHFKANSPLVDHGTNIGVPTSDFDGNSRPYDGDRNSVAEFDIGPYEYINTPPEIVSDSVVTVNEDQSYAYQVVAVDPDTNEVLNFILITAPSFLLINDPLVGEITGIPENDDVGFHNVVVQVSDLNGEIDTQSYTLEVIQVNDPPVVDDIPGQSIAEGSIFDAILLNDYVDDPDHSDSEISWIASGNVDLSVAIDSETNVATISTLNANWYGEEIITFTAIDGGGLTDADTAIFTVTPVNDPPVISPPISDRTIAEGGSFSSIDLDDYVEDVDNPDGELIWSASTTTHITITITDRVAEITVNDPEWNGSETVTFTVEDPAGLTDDEDVIFTVTAVNDPPIITDIPGQSVPEGSNFTSVNLNDYVSDTDNSKSELSWANSATTNITVTITDSIAVITANNLEWNGSETVTFTVEDPGGLADSDNALFTITAVNDTPAVADIPDQTIPEGDSFSSITLDNYVSDVDNADEEINWTASSTTNIAVTITDRVAEITVNDPEWNGSEIVTFTAEDSAGLTDSDDVTFTVSELNDPPIITDIPDQIIKEDSSFTSINLDDYVSDADNTDAEISWTASTTTNITITITDRVASITINDVEWNGSESVTFTAEDPNGLTDTDNATFTVTPINDPPVVSDIPDQNIPEDGSFATIILDNYVSDADNADTEILWTTSTTTDITVTISDRIATITVNDPEWNGSEAVIFTAEDPGGLSDSTDVLFTVTAVNDPPQITPLSGFTFNEDDSLIIAIATLYDYVEDPDNPDSLLIITFRTGQNVIAYADSPNVIVKAPANWNGLDTLEVKVSDGELADSVKVPVVVKSVNDIPYFTDLPDTISFDNDSDSTLTMSMYAMDVDLPNDNLTWVFDVSNTALNLDFNDVSTELTLSAPDFTGVITVICTVTDDSSASVIDSFFVEVKIPTAVEEITEIIPTAYELNQNYPNPFNPLTNIKFALPKSGSVKIYVYNILGQHILTVFDGYKEAGYHIIKFNADNLSSGLYFYSMQSGEFKQVKKMLLMK